MMTELSCLGELSLLERWHFELNVHWKILFLRMSGFYKMRICDLTDSNDRLNVTLKGERAGIAFSLQAFWMMSFDASSFPIIHGLWQHRPISTAHQKSRAGAKYHGKPCNNPLLLPEVYMRFCELSSLCLLCKTGFFHYLTSVYVYIMLLRALVL